MADHPVQIVSVENDHVRVWIDEFRKVLNRVGPRPVAVVSILGPKGTGKSYTMNRFLRYLNWSDQTSNWMNVTVANEFPTDRSDQAPSAGIFLWSKPFVALKDGREVAVLLMDTQGSFDGQTSSVNFEDYYVLALCCALSSVVLWNGTRDLTEESLQFLMLIKSWSTLHLEDKSCAAVSKLTFLIRDWEHPETFAFGYHGDDSSQHMALAQNYKKSRFDPRPHMTEETKVVREYLSSIFGAVECSLLANPNFYRAAQPSGEFVNGLGAFISWVLAPDSLVIKKFPESGSAGEQLLRIAQKGVQFYASKAICPNRNAAVRTATFQNLLAHLTSLKFYQGAVKATAKGERLTLEMVEQRHLAAKENALRMFRQFNRLHNDAIRETYAKILQEAIEKTLQSWRAHFKGAAGPRQPDAFDAPVQESLEKERELYRREQELLNKEQQLLRKEREQLEKGAFGLEFRSKRSESTTSC